mmetsp:Transcript_15795/g.36120  ORF Transcript_15795/g.36120 Transcript_15795/m.36120 type:complete len:282 (-) Transcript_15795:36-881(-)
MPLLCSCLLCCSAPYPKRRFGCIVCLLVLKSSKHWLLAGRNCETVALWNKLPLAFSVTLLPLPAREESTRVAIISGCRSRSDMRRDGSMLTTGASKEEEEEGGFSANSFPCIFCFLRARPALGCHASWNLDTTSRKRSTEQTLATWGKRSTRCLQPCISSSRSRGLDGSFHTRMLKRYIPAPSGSTRFVRAFTRRSRSLRNPPACTALLNSASCSPYLLLPPSVFTHDGKHSASAAYNENGPLRATMSLMLSVGAQTVWANCLASSLFSADADVRPMVNRG